MKKNKYIYCERKTQRSSIAVCICVCPGCKDLEKWLKTVWLRDLCGDDDAQYKRLGGL